MMSGGPIRKFTNGWAIALFRGGPRAHYFKRQQASIAESACGKVTAPTAALRAAGTFRLCKTCERIVAKVSSAQ